VYRREVLVSGAEFFRSADIPITGNAPGNTPLSNHSRERIAGTKSPRVSGTKNTLLLSIVLVVDRDPYRIIIYNPYITG